MKRKVWKENEMVICFLFEIWEQWTLDNRFYKKEIRGRGFFDPFRTVSNLTSD